MMKLYSLPFQKTKVPTVHDQEPYGIFVYSGVPYVKQRPMFVSNNIAQSIYWLRTLISTVCSNSRFHRLQYCLFIDPYWVKKGTKTLGKNALNCNCQFTIYQFVLVLIKQFYSESTYNGLIGSTLPPQNKPKLFKLFLPTFGFLIFILIKTKVELGKFLYKKNVNFCLRLCNKK